MMVTDATNFVYIGCAAWPVKAAAQKASVRGPGKGLHKPLRLPY
jgi:hypothetical protein